VVYGILYEKLILQLLNKKNTPSFINLETSRNNLIYYIRYILSLLETNNFLIHEQITLADITAAAHISVLDYLNEIQWEQYPKQFQDWYASIKSRPSFQDILNDYLLELKPSQHYSALDW
jgi:glutathione S-transferase